MTGHPFDAILAESTRTSFDKIPTVPSEQAPAVRHGLVRREQHDVALLVREAERQHLRHELADLARREIDDGGDLSPNQLAGLIVLRDLRAGFPGADAGAEIDQEFQR